jgi:type IX secretion system PorP/SprF family membrane protein
MLVNPAYTGSLDYMQAIAGFRSQWLSVPGSPKTATVTVQGPLINENMGLGLTFSNDQLGVLQSNFVQATYAYRLKLEKSTLAFGLQTGIRNFSAALQDVNLNTNVLYDAAFSNNISIWNFNFGTGAFWYGDKWFAGVSLPHLRNHQLVDQDFTELVESRYRTQWHLHGGYVFDLNDQIKLKPAAMIKSVSGAPLQLDLGATAYWKETLSFGTAYRTADALSFFADFRLSKNFRFGYAYDQVLSALRGNAGGSHELMLRYDFSVKSGEIVFRPF